jgi:hypothetical protein
MNRTGVAIVVLVSVLFVAASPGPATYEDVAALSPSAKAGKRESVRKLFSLLEYSDGAVTEDIDIALGATICKRPRLFLEEMKRSGIATREAYLPGLLGNLGEEFVDRYDAQAEELSNRRTALLTVTAPELVLLRDRCIQELDQQIQDTSEAIRGAKP